MHSLITLINEVDNTHPRLGHLIALAVIAVKAKQFLLVVAPTGCGKSAIGLVLKKNCKNFEKISSITDAKFVDYVDIFTNFTGLVYLDDFSRIGSEYERKQTIIDFCTLCHEHSLDKHTMTSEYNIENFQGATILNVQPTLLAGLYSSPEWEGLLQDKSLRYYHLFRPIKPQKLPPNVIIDWGLEIDKVPEQNFSGKIYEKLLIIAEIEWSISRAKQHLDMLLRAMVALDSRTKIQEEDYQLLYELMRPMRIESFLFSKQHFESERSLDADLAALIVEFVSYPKLNVDNIMRDYKVRRSTAYALIHKYNGKWLTLKNNYLIPSKELMKILKLLGVEK